MKKRVQYYATSFSQPVCERRRFTTAVGRDHDGGLAVHQGENEL